MDVIDLRSSAENRKLKEENARLSARHDRAVENMVLAANATARAAVLLKACRAKLHTLPADDAEAVELLVKINDLLGD